MAFGSWEPQNLDTFFLNGSYKGKKSWKKKEIFFYFFTIKKQNQNQNQNQNHLYLVLLETGTDPSNLQGKYFWCCMIAMDAMPCCMQELQHIVLGYHICCASLPLHTQTTHSPDQPEEQSLSCDHLCLSSLCLCQLMISDQTCLFFSNSFSLCNPHLKKTPQNPKILTWEMHIFWCPVPKVLVSGSFKMPGHSPMVPYQKIGVSLILGRFFTQNTKNSILSILGEKMPQNQKTHFFAMGS